jgi:hypothetical protein
MKMIVTPCIQTMKKPNKKPAASGPPKFPTPWDLDAPEAQRRVFYSGKGS